MKKLVYCLICGLACSLGCQPVAESTSGKSNSAATTDAHDDHDHSGHDHGEVGPHGGHFLHLEPTHAHAEWTHDDDAKTITVYLDEFDQDVIQEAKFVVEIPNAESEQFPLTKTDDGWTGPSDALMAHLNMGDVVKVRFVMSDASGEQTAVVEHADHHGHSH